MFNSFPIPKPDSGGGSNIKSIQSGSTVVNGTVVTAAITAVDMSKAILLFSFTYISASSPNPYVTAVRGELLNSSTLAFSVNVFSGAIAVEWTVIEFNNVKSIQRGMRSHANATTEESVTISSVATNKSLIFATFSSGNSGADASGMTLKYRFINNTSIGLTQVQNSPGSIIINWQVIEFN